MERLCILWIERLLNGGLRHENFNRYVRYRLHAFRGNRISGDAERKDRRQLRLGRCPGDR